MDMDILTRKVEPQELRTAESAINDAHFHVRSGDEFMFYDEGLVKGLRRMDEAKIPMTEGRVYAEENAWARVLRINEDKPLSIDERAQAFVYDAAVQMRAFSLLEATGEGSSPWDKQKAAENVKRVEALVEPMGATLPGDTSDRRELIRLSSGEYGEISEERRTDVYMGLFTSMAAKLPDAETPRMAVDRAAAFEASMAGWGR